MARNRSRLPGLQVPSTVEDPELRILLEAVKERLELLSGERGDQNARALTASETTTLVNNSIAAASPDDAEVLDLSLLTQLPLTSVPPNYNMLVQGGTTTDRYSTPVGDLFEAFTSPYETESITATWSFGSDILGFRIRAVTPRFRMTELADEDSIDSLDSDESNWDHVVEGRAYSLRLVDDDDSIDVTAYEVVRDVMTASRMDVQTTGLQHNGSQVITEAGAGLTKSFNTLHPNDFTITLSTDLSGAVSIVDLSSATLAATIANNAVTYTKLQDASALSVLGRRENSVGDPGDIVAVANNQVLRRQNNALDFGPITSAYISDFAEAVRDRAGAMFEDNSEIDFSYDDSLDGIDSVDSIGGVTARIVRSIHPIWTGRHRWVDNERIELGTGADLRLYHDGTDNLVVSGTGNLRFLPGSAETSFFDLTNGYLACRLTPADIAGPSGMALAGTGLYVNRVLQVPRVGNTSNIRQTRIEGSYASPTTLLSGTNIAQNSFLSYNGTTVDTGATYIVTALEDWTASAMGSMWQFQTCAIGSASLSTRMKIASGVYDNALTDKGINTLNFSRLYEGGAEARNRRNHLKNGAFNVAQTATTFATAADASLTLDEWYVLTQTASIQVDQVAAPFDGARYNIKGTQTQVASQRFAFQQILLGRDCKHLRGQTVQASMRVKTSAAATVRLFIVEWTGTEDAATVDIVNTWTSTTFTVNNFFINSTLTIVGPASTGTTTPATWTDLTVTGTLSSSFNNLYVFAYISGAQATNATFEIANAHLTLGSTPPVSPFITTTTPAEDYLRVWAKSTGLSILQDNAEVQLGLGADLRLYHDGTNSVLRTDTGSLKALIGATETARFDSDSTAGNTRFMLYDVDNGTLERVSVGAADSGGTGFKVLRIPN
jgi:hypothetical protein